MANYIWSILIFLWVSCVAGEIENGCIVYDFEIDLEELKHDSSICGSLPLWTVGNYSDIVVESPNSASELFISPELTLSCISLLKFRASGGVVEINVYMDGKSPSDIVQAILMMTSGINDMVVAMATLSPSMADVNGWHALKLEILDHFGDFEGYIALLGSKSEESTLLVDSIRYISKTTDANACLIYEQNEEPNQCVTYNFESDFDVLFTSDNSLCNGLQYWNLYNYTTANVESPDARSSMFISPGNELSCTASVVFNMEPNGVIEARVYIEPKSNLDNIIIIAQKVTSPVDTVAGFKMYYPESQQFVPGWNVLSFPVVDFNSFDGYLIIFGSAADGSTVLIDSVRYIPPFTSPTDESCVLY